MQGIPALGIENVALAVVQAEEQNTAFCQVD